VAVLDLNLIPQVVDVVIGDYLYELKFRVESEAEGDQPLPMDMDHSGKMMMMNFRIKTRITKWVKEGIRGRA
jgi:hypothetical protein